VPLLFLDIDGTVRHGANERDGKFVNGPEDVVIFPDALKRMSTWVGDGGRIIGVSNQGGVSMGLTQWERVQAAMDETDRQTDRLFEMILFCIHHPRALRADLRKCACRKPAPGLLIQGMIELKRRFPLEDYPVARMLMVGDRPEDREAARRINVNFLTADVWRSRT
jgi:D-glycero-D-manno-heptose 1,7-bisphosphate phosphatase